MTAKIYLEQALREGTLPHALLLTGPDTEEKRAFAVAVAVRVQGKEGSPDLHIFEPESKSGFYSIEVIREILEQVHIAPYSAPKKVFLIHRAEKIVAPAAHALLKTLEEPPLDTLFLLLTHQKGEVLPTIASRCIELHLPSKESKEARKWLFDALATGQMPVGEEVREEGLVHEILGYFRDQEARRHQIPLLYPEAPKVAYSIPPMEAIETLIAEMEDALLRQMKPAICLEHFLSSIVRGNKL